MTSTTNPYKKAISHTALYGVANISRKIVGFIMLPIYTRYLTPEDYGTVELMMMVVVLIEVFLAMRMEQAIFRYYSLAKDSQEKKAVMSTAYLMTLFTSTIAFVILTTNASGVTQFFLGDTRYTELMRILAILLVTQALEEYGLIYIRVHQKALLFLVLNILKLILSLSLNIYFIVFLELSVAGIVYSACISTGVMALIGTIYTFYYSGASFSRSLLKRLVLFSYPLWIASFGGFYADSSVKYFLRVFSSIDDVGIYALALKFATLIFVLAWDPFSNIWQSLRYEIYEMSEPNKVYKKIFIILVLVMSLVGLGLSLFSDTVIQLMADKAFWSAGALVPILVMAKIVWSLTNFNNFGILLKKKTGILAVGTYLNALMVTIGSVTLIPIFGIIGAALAILMGGIFQLFWIEWKSKQLYDMQLPWLRVAIISLVWLICYSLSLLLPEALLISIPGKILIVVLYMWLLFKLPILKKEEKEQLLEYLKIGVAKTSNYITLKKI